MRIPRCCFPNSSATGRRPSAEKRRPIEMKAAGFTHFFMLDYTYPGNIREPPQNIHLSAYVGLAASAPIEHWPPEHSARRYG